MTGGRYQSGLDPHHRIEATKDIIRLEFVKIGESSESEDRQNRRIGDFETSTTPPITCILRFWLIKSYFNKKGSWFNSNCLNKLDEISLDTLNVSLRINQYFVFFSGLYRFWF